MSQAQRILWGEGVFLRPQHFQQQELLLEARIAHCLAFTRAFPWGVEDAAWDADALKAGLLALNRLELTFQDGTCLQAPDRDPLPSARNLAQLPDLPPTVRVHACLPMLNPFGGNCLAPSEQPNRPTRFRAAQSRLPDLFTDGLESDVTVLHPEVHLLLDGENLDGHLGFPVARIQRDPSGCWELDGTYIPPSVTLKGARPLQALVKRLVEILQVKSRSLASAYRERALGLVEFGAADMATFWLLHTVNRALPVLGHLTAFPQAHPEEAYRTLTQLAGELTTFSTHHDPAGLPAYRHGHLTETFQELEALLRELLDTVLSERSVVVPLRETRPSFHVGHLESDRLLEGCDFYLSVTGDRPAAEILEAVPLKVKVGSPDDVDQLLHSGLPGVALTHVNRLPSALPVRVGNHYFALDPGGAGFRRMIQGRSICIYVPQSLPFVNLQLIAVLP